MGLREDFAAKQSKRIKNILSDLSEYYSDKSEWLEYSENLVKYGLFYSEACSAWIEAILLYDFELLPFGENILSIETNAQIDRGKFQKHHYSVLRQYCIDRAVVNLLLNKGIDRKNLENASAYHYAHLKENEYPSEIDVLSEVSSDVALSIFVPQILINKLLDIDYTEVINHIEPGIKTSEKIWGSAWRILYNVSNDSQNTFDKCWSDLIIEWRECYINSNIFGFNNSMLVLLYYLYCQIISRPFDIKDLSNDILRF